MLNINTKETEARIDIIVSNENSSFTIFYGGNLDLYFVPDIFGMKLYNSIKPINFIINKEDGFLFDSFINLYEKVTSYDAYDGSDDSFKKKEKYQDALREYPLVHDNIITWHSDEDICGFPSVLNIFKLDKDNINLEFNKNNPEDVMFMTYSIRFRNSGSMYSPFNCRFMELYNNLCSYYKEKDKKLTLNK